MIYWFYLGCAIVFEVFGTLSMQYSNVSHNMIGYVIMAIMISSSYFMLAKAVQRIDLGIAYALWEGIGVVIITIFSVLLFNEPISPLKAIGLGVLVLGISLLKSGSAPRPEKVKKPALVKEKTRKEKERKEKEEGYATA